jgi:hypothetical protein
MNKVLLYALNILFGFAAYRISGNPLFIFTVIQVNIFAMMLQEKR